MDDFYISPDGARQYLLTNDAAEYSLWRKDSEWERILCTATGPTTKYIVRSSPDSNDVVYIADQGGTAMFYTTDAGENKWTIRSSRYTIQDVAVESTDVAYVGRSGQTSVSKTTNGGFTWASSKDTNLSGGNIHTILSLSEDNLFVGSTLGYVSYSTDGNSSWTKISKLTETGALLTQVAATGLEDGDFIFAASTLAATTVRRWEIGTSTSWKNIDAASAGFMCYGIALNNGTLYVLNSDGVNSEVLRSIGPTADTPAFSNIASALEVFDVAPSALRVAAGSNKLWAIETSAAPDELWSYTDTLADTAIELLSPANKFQNQMNPVTGRSVDIAFSWTKPSTSVTAYDLNIYSDPDAKYLIRTTAVASTSSTVVQLVGPYQAAATVEFSPGTTYYWRTRVSAAGPVLSPWSEMRSFTVEPGVAQVPTILAPTNGKLDASRTPSFSWDPVSGAKTYNFVLADNVALANPIVDVNVTSTGYAISQDLAYGKTYFWAVKPIAPVDGAWSAIANFTVMTKPVEAAPPIVIETVPPPVINIPAPPPAQEIIIPPAPAAPAQIAPAYIWAIIIIGAVLVIAVVILIVRTRRAV